MLQNTLIAKKLFRSQSISVISNFLSGPITSKCLPQKSVLQQIQRTSVVLPIRSFCYNYDGMDPEGVKFLKRISSPEEASKIRLMEITERLDHWHSYFSQEAKKLSKAGKPSTSMEEAKISYRKRWATYRLLNKIDDVARRLIDKNVDDKCRFFYLVDPNEKWVIHTEKTEEFHVVQFEECWMSLLKSSKLPLAQELRKKLKKSGLSHFTFTDCIGMVHMELHANLMASDFWSLELVDFGPEDVEGVLTDLLMSQEYHECMKILFNLEEPKEWQLKDRYYFS